MGVSRKARGMRDILPEDEIARREITGAIEGSYIKYGFDPVSHPAIERIDVLEAKSGEGIKTEIFRIDDSELGLRFDLTVSLARMYAENAELPLPFKRYCIEKVWRREEPQYGRYREFLQADADIIGSAGMECEAELIACACDALDGLYIGKYRVCINNRKLLTGVLAQMGIGGDKASTAMRIIDKLDKKERADVEGELLQNGFSNAGEIIDAFTHDMEYYAKIPECGEAVAELKALFTLLDDYGIAYEFDPSIVRGLGYYTGPVYEIKGEDMRLGTIAAGGRYDGLIGIYAGRDVPATGISFGIDRLAVLISERGKRGTRTKIVLVSVSEKNMKACIKYARKLRAMGFAVRTDLMGRSMRKQLDYASSIGAEFAGIVGDNEEKENKLAVKDLATGKQEIIGIDDEKGMRKVLGSE